MVLHVAFARSVDNGGGSSDQRHLKAGSVSPRGTYDSKYLI